MLGPYNADELGAVTVYEDPDCHGQTSRFYWNPSDPLGGQYNREDMSFGGYRSKTMNSITVPEGYYVELYEWEGFGGSSEVVRGEYAESETEKLKCINVRQDRYRSMIIKKEIKGGIKGYWQGITSTESQDFSYYVGIRQN